jgi:Uri superfamily endonuclease
VGSIGRFSFQEGRYFYVGSARRSMLSRVNRHLRRDKRIFWHIDYLLSCRVSQIEKIWLGSNVSECCLAKMIESVDKVKGVRRFGCSDCGCPSHLFYADSKTVKLSRLLKELKLVEFNLDK